MSVCKDCQLPDQLKPTVKLIEIEVTLWDNDDKIYHALALLDTGASSEFISSSLVSKARIPCNALRKPIKITTAEGKSSLSKYRTQSLALRAGKFKTEAEFTVMDLARYDMILGMPFINRNQISITGGRPVSVSAPCKNKMIRLPINMYQDHQDRLPVGVHVCYSLEEFQKGLKEEEEVFLLVPEKEDSAKEASGTDKWKGIVMEGQQATIQEKVDGAIEVAPETQKSLKDLLNQYSDVFPDDLPMELPKHPVEHRIEVDPSAKIPCKRPYRTSIQDDEVIRTTLDYLLEHGLIGASCSPYASPVLVVPKPDGTKRFCIDYRGLNSITKLDRYPIPRIDDLLDQIRGAKYYTRIDLRSGYWQMKIRDEDVEKTGFITKYGTYEWRVLPFGLCNAPSSYQRMVNLFFGDLYGNFVAAYLDDLVIYSNSEEEHLRHLQILLERLQKNKLYGKLSKCDFFKTQIDFLGHIVSRDGVRTNPRKIQAIKDWPVPKDLKQLRGFLGICNFYRRFIPRFAHLARPLTDLLKGKVTNTVVHCGKDALRAMENLKEAMGASYLLRQYDPSLPTEVWADASSDARCIGAVLMQDDGNGLRPVAFLSRVLNDAEAKYSTYEQELLAVKYSLEHWRHYLLPLEFTIRSDHHSLQYLQTQPVLNPRQARWIIFFQEFRFKQIRYRPGQKMQVPDALSRRPVAPADFNIDDVIGLGKNPTEDNIKLPGTKIVLNLETSEDIQYLYSLNHPPELQEFVNSAKSNEDISMKDRNDLQEKLELHVLTRKSAIINRDLGPDTGGTSGIPESPQREITPPSTEKPDTQGEPVLPEYPEPDSLYRLKYDYLSCKDFSKIYQELVQTPDSKDHRLKIYCLSADKKYLLWRTDPLLPWRVCVPTDQRKIVLYESHDSPLGAHAGVEKTLDKMRRFYYWPHMKDMVQTYVQTCEKCQRNKTVNAKPYGEAQIMPIPDAPFETMSLDLMTGLSKSKSGNDCIVVFTCALSKYAIIVPCTKDVSALDIAMIFYKHVFRKFGLPLKMISDRDPKFMGKFWKALYKCLGTRLTPTSPYRPQTDGQTERMNRTFTEAVRAFVNAKMTDWDEFVPSLEFAYNDSVHRATGYTPFELIHGWQPRTPLQPIIPSNVPAANDMALKMANDIAMAKDRLLKVRATTAFYQNQNYRPHQFKAGDMVLLKTTNLKLQLPSRKLSPLFIGPFEIERMKGPNAVHLKFSKRLQQVCPVQNVEYLRPYHPRNPHMGAFCPIPPAPIQVDGEEEFEVEDILAHRTMGKQLQYLIRWKGYTARDDSWEPAAEIRKRCGEIIREYNQRQASI